MGIKPETIGEVHIMFENLLDEVRKLSDDLRINTSLSQDIHSEVKKTNGRVNIIEPLAMDYQKKRERVAGAVFIICLVGGSAVAVGGFVLNSYISYKTKQITYNVLEEVKSDQIIKPK